MVEPTTFTLPVWVAVAARGALRQLRGEPFQAQESLELLEPPGQCPVPLEEAAPLGPGEALAISRCDPGPGLDLTRGLAVWVRARWGDASGEAPGDPSAPGRCFQLRAGEGVGRLGPGGDPCLSDYCLRLLQVNLAPLVPPDRVVELEVLLPQGRALAERTSNAAFGVVEGLALIGTQAQVQSSAAPDQLGRALGELRRRAALPGGCPELILVVGENGLDLAGRFGLPAPLLLKAGNWLGPLLAAAGELGVQRLLLWGYHGKLLKLAGGIFHTHHHLADGRAELLTALAALEGVDGATLAALFEAPTVEQALQGLALADAAAAERLRQRLVRSIEQRSAAYIKRTAGVQLQPGVALFDRSRQLWALGPVGEQLWRELAP